MGFRWRIAEVQHAGAKIAIPTSLDGSVSFTAGQTLLAHDGVNGYGGRFALTDDGYRVSSMAVSLVGMARSAPQDVVALVGAVRAITEQTGDVHVEADGDQMYLSRNGYKIACTRIGVALDPPTPASPTPTHSGS